MVDTNNFTLMRHLLKGRGRLHEQFYVSFEQVTSLGIEMRVGARARWAKIWSPRRVKWPSRLSAALLTSTASFDSIWELQGGILWVGILCIGNDNDHLQDTLYFCFLKISLQRCSLLFDFCLRLRLANRFKNLYRGQLFNSAFSLKFHSQRCSLLLSMSI